MKRFLVATLSATLSSASAWAVCDTGDPGNVENDCDLDGCKVGQGDCADVNPNFPAAPTNGNQNVKGPGCPGGAIAEVCDNRDNNCNNQTDENNPGGGGACNVPGQQGPCQPGLNRCMGGAIICAQQVFSSTEVCDGVDNNCNGQTDESLTRLCYAGPAGTFTGTCPPTANTGAAAVTSCTPRLVCAGVTQTCAGGTFPTCTAATAGQTLPQTETCDGLDNDCDGNVDNNVAGVGMACTVPGQQGPCATGQMRCVVGMGVQCVQTVNPGTEICDGIDNNCNGLVDDRAGFGANSLVRTCFAGAAGSFTGTCPPANNQTVGNCTPRGPCAGVQQACGGAAGFPACSAATPGQTLPQTETCNNVDDNCDGNVDNNIAVVTCAVGGGVGRCANGNSTCTAGVVGCAPLTAIAETCNNIDDNCNGMVDDGVTRTCYAGPAGTYTGTCPPPNNTQPGNCTPRGPCAGVTQACSAGAFPACTAATPGQTGPSTEVCDGIDNNCDNQVDNGVAGVGQTCAVSGGVGRCANGNTQCQAGGNLVCQPLTPIAETCNNIDDNCNNRIDDLPDGGPLLQLCFTGPAGTFGGSCPGPSCSPRGVCRPSNQACMAGVWDNAVCNGQTLPTAAPPSAGEPANLCNGLDDDCDGTVDDGNPGGGGMCNAAAMGVCAFGTLNCQAAMVVCTPAPPQTEQCNTVDENCNGVPNDVPPRRCFSGPNVTPATYTGVCPGPMCNPKGACTAGQQLCDTAGNFGTCALADGGVLTTPANPPADDELVCNGIDDDCDGVVDDGNFDLDSDGVKYCSGDCNDDPDGGARQKPGLLEICDGVDNNCDGFVDGNNTPCYSGPPGTVLADGGVGQCRAGMGPCIAGMMPPANMCVGQVLPGVEGNVCDRIDNDCDGKVDEDFDLDGDGVPSCTLCPLITPCDCNDDPDGGIFVKPGSPEVCDCADNNCNGTADEGNVCRAAPCHDFDFDRVTNCQGDCNDNNNQVGPNKSERRNNGVDDDCDGQIDEDTDEDGDMFTVGQGDCDDKFASVNPGAMEKCDGFDNNCNGVVDEGFDMDGDNASTCVGDCNDNDATISPFKNELCGNMKDDDCDGLVDEDLDEDGDGVSSCNNDCNDHNASVHPAFMSIAVATEVCDGQDNDCDGLFDEGFDQDVDGVPVCFGDCDDNDPTRSPLLYEVPTAMGGTPKDENCNGQIDEGSADRDMDGFTGFCGDCNDSDRTINPHGTEVCDRVDNNCDGLVDALPGMSNLCAACFDNDHDGQTNCDGDCDDADSAVFRGAIEVCDGKLNACGSSIGVDLDDNGFRVCRDDGGMGIDGGEDAGTTDAGMGGTGGGSQPVTDGGPGTERPIVTTDCGCGSEGTAMPMVMLAMLLLYSRKKRAALTLLLLCCVPLLGGCRSSLTYPEPAVPDSGEGVDAGPSDGGFMPPVDNWNCPGLYPTEQIPVLVPGTMNPFAISPRFQRTQLDSAGAWVFDDGVADVAAFVLVREVPMDVDQTQELQALDTIAVREIGGLDTLLGTPLVRDRSERSSRVYQGAVGSSPAYSTSQNLTFATATNAFALRNRLLASFSGQTLASLGALPPVMGASAEDKLVVNVMFRITDSKLFISVAVSTLAKLKQNQPVLLDLTNGSSLGDKNAKLQYRCEHRIAPALKSDFIFVVDNSGSMSQEQAALVAASSSLYSAFGSAGLDFRLGAITTDSDVLRGTGFTRDLAQFQSDVNVGINGNGFEMGLEYALRAIRLLRTPTAPPARQLRDDAGLVIVILSDEENAGLKSVAQYVQDFVNEKAVIFAIVGPKPIGCSRVGLGNANAGGEYIDAAVGTGGSSGSICNPNLLEIVEEVVVGSLGAASKSPLEQRPISNSLSVQTVMPVARSRTMGFDYDPGGNTILFFGTVPAEGTKFDAAYSYFAVID